MKRREWTLRLFTAILAGMLAACSDGDLVCGGGGTPFRPEVQRMARGAFVLTSVRALGDDEYSETTNLVPPRIELTVNDDSLVLVTKKKNGASKSTTYAVLKKEICLTGPYSADESGCTPYTEVNPRDWWLRRAVAPLPGRTTSSSSMVGGHFAIRREDCRRDFPSSTIPATGSPCTPERVPS